MEYWWIIRSPILLAVLLEIRLWLAKSTLTLIPLLGIHSVLFSFVTDESTSNGALSLRLTKLFIDLFFNSFQVWKS
ncbi:hypothetical protein cypCar_00037610 [Cyprinus carpio]|nr:hypothetical protein cypCar_00037610 [Cyprinus carpio]